MTTARRTPRISERFVPVRRDAVQTINIGGEAVLLDEVDERLHLLNSTGAIVWACFDGESNLGDIVSDLSAELRVPRGLVLSETLAITRRLGEEGLLANLMKRKIVGERASGPDHEEADASMDPRFVPEPPNP